MPDQWIEVDQEVPFSHSVLWEAQRRYFDELGVLAWDGSVPFYITSNPLISQNYAKIIANYALDLKHRGELDTTEPLYVLELGTGSGQFSYLCLRHLLEMKAQLGISDVPICYVMTDFTEENLKFWQEHELFKPYVESGDLDFAVFDLEETEEIVLLSSSLAEEESASSSISAVTRLGGGESAKLRNPLVVIANYIFDTVKHDIFRVENGRLHESLLTLSAQADNVKDELPIKLENLEASFTHHVIEGDYYSDPVLDPILQSYASLLNEGTFLFPTGTFKALDTLNHLSNNRMLIIATDKGFTGLEEMEGRGDPMIAFHGSVSMSVNFHAINQYFKVKGGDALFQSPRDGIKSCVFSLGHQLSDLPLTLQSANLHIAGFGPSDFFHFHRMIRETDKLTLERLLSHMHFCRWDPYIFSIFASRIHKELGKASGNVVNGFLLGADELQKNVYPMPGAEDHYLNIGVMLHHQNLHEQALKLYELSLKHYGEKFASVFNAGLCLAMIDQWELALPYFERAKNMEAGGESQRASDWYEDALSRISH